ncbi:Type III restriction-modification system restriction subunit R [Planctomycetales bacterium 10988]|nr:Type III restriction-modification system restriction subunit R [Planctomycetales bacterium 10988]
MGKKRAKKNETPPLRFDEKLVLNQWMLSLFEVSSFDKLAENLKPLELEGLDENNVHRFLHQMKLLWEYAEFPGDTLLGYDQNIVKHTLALSEKRAEPLKWKYFQYLSLLFTEVYLDRFFRDPEKLLADLNQHVTKFNEGKSTKEQIPEYQPEDLRKLAFWNATGSGKTLLMHVNILQYQHYLKLHDKEKSLNRIILLTPNEGLSKQHLEEFDASGIDADQFSKESRSLFSGKTVEIIEVTKLKEEMGQKTVAIDAFEGNNLVLVDEGHRGASASVEGAWMSARNRLCENGFSFEYSATFGQAMKGKKGLEPIYAKNILFDYSYKYFYRDGFGKDYRILNLADDSDEERRRLYLTACLVAFYQQQKLYDVNPDTFRPFLLEKPLWVFVGGKVNAVRTVKKKAVSDVVDILLVLSEFVKNKRESISLLDRLLSGKPGLLNQRGEEIFATAFPYLVSTKLSGEEIYNDILKVLFNSSTQAALHVENLKGTDGEIALRLGENDAFGLINVGDAPKLCKLCENFPDDLIVTEKEFSGSLFREINEDNSTVNVLIGSKKFTEGWNSWRVSTMGLMNVGKKEGSEIIQLFGRGVRLKGHDMTLKRSSQLEGIERPKNIRLLETLNIFGVRADYMRQFKEYLEDEGLPGNEERIEFILPVVKNLNGKKLTSVRIEEGKDFKAHGPKPTLAEPFERLLRHPVSLNWYPKIQAQQSKGVAKTEDSAVKHEGTLEEKHLAFMDIDAIWFELQHFKNERSWYNLNLNRDCIEPLLLDSRWYKLFIPPEELEFTSFDRVRRWEEIAVALLKKYTDRYYKNKKQEWESDFYEYHELREDDKNFVTEYRLLIDESQEAIVEKLGELKGKIEDGTLADWSFGNLHAISFGQHLYQPLLLFKSDFVDVSPVSLNQGEKEFVTDLRTFYDDNPTFFEDQELYLLRNMSRGRGIGFFEAGNFYPDFLLWLLTDDNQYVTFVDPKGIRNLEGPDDPKIRFYRTIKELEARLGDPNVILNSFIISNTPFQQVRWWTEDLSKDEFTKAHVLFQKEDRNTYIKRLLTTAASEQQVTVDT